MAVEVLNDRGEVKRLRFVRNTAYNGKDYGPGLPDGDTAEVDSHWAPIFIANGRAVEADGSTDGSASGPTTGAVEIRDPTPEHRDPELPLEPEKKK